MKVTCPSCGADMDLDVLLAHEDSRRALLRLVEISMPLAKVMVQYLRLFKPAKRAMGISRVVKLLEELLPDVQRGFVTHKGREWAAPVAAWQEAVQVMLGRRDEGKLKVPLTSHAYLYEVLSGIADKSEGLAERGLEAVRRQRVVVYPASPHPASQSVVEALAPRPLPAAPAKPVGPSMYAKKLAAENAQRLAARTPTAQADQGGTNGVE